MAPKRTYSKRTAQTPLAQQIHRKRHKLDQGDAELSWPGDPPRSRPQTSTSSTTRKVKFGGPVSFPDDGDGDDDTVDTEEDSSKAKASSKAKTSSLFDKALNGKLKPVKPRQPNIHGSREDFQNIMTDPNRTKKSNAGATSSYLPTPPSDVESQQTKNFNTIFPGLAGRGPSVLNGTKFGAKHKQSTSIFDREETSKTVSSANEVMNDEKPKELYVQKQYEADKVSAPSRDICGNRLSSKSRIAALWTTNQTDSPFLRLPGEVRNRIYDFAFGDKTIKIGYQTYSKATWNPGVTSVFKYHCTVIDRKTDPFNKILLKKWPVSNSFTLLSDICRQLYLETACLPYTANHVAFESHNIMVNFVLHEKRLSREQRHAITLLILPDDVPSGNMLAYLPNVERVWLAFEQYQKPKGWYKVVRKGGKKAYLTDPQDYLVEEL